MLDMSRGLRMDGRKCPISLLALNERTDAIGASPESVHKGSTVIYAGNAQRISEGFATALRAMGVEADILPSDIAQSDTTSNPEDS
jgi:ribosomal protein L2